MRAVWQLAINSLAGRRGRTSLLVAAVTLATALSVLVACAIGTLQESYSQSMAAVAGLSDLQVLHRAYGRFDGQILENVRSWPEVLNATARYDHKGPTILLERTDKREPVEIHGVEPQYDRLFFPARLLEGRYIEADGEAVIDGRVQKQLDAKLGDEIGIEWQATKLKVVGIMEQPPLTVMQLPAVYVTLPTAQKIAGYPGQIHRIDIQLKKDAPIDLALPVEEGKEPTAGDTLVAKYKAQLPDNVVMNPPASVRAGINRGVKWTNLISQIVTVLVCLSTMFIIVTGLTTAVTERTRELAIMRCIGTGRMQIAAAQVTAGGAIAALGALLGTPLGIALGYLIYKYNEEILRSGFIADPYTIGRAIVATIFAGMVGALYPAILAARVQPLEALAARAHKPRMTMVIVCAVVGVACILFQPAVFALPVDDESAFWIYLPWGLATTFAGYCLICVPVAVALARPLCNLLTRMLKLPGVLLQETVMSTPFRHGLTAGALMMGLAMLLAIWTEGGNLLYGWFDTIKMPDAFIKTSSGFDEDMLKIVRDEPGVRGVSAVRAKPVQTHSISFGVKSISPPYTLFAASDVAQFVDMTDMDWIQGDKETALKRIKEGNAVLVGREYLVARGLGVGSKVVLKSGRKGESVVEFDIVGVVGATGLDVAVQHFGIATQYAEASVSTVFGSREDGRKYFLMEEPDLVLIAMTKEADDQAVLASLKNKLGALSRGELRADSSRTIRKKIHAVSTKLMTVASSLALSALLIASFGVANLIVAEIHARRFEYGVLRAIGGQRGLLGRLIAGQTLFVAIIACVTGTALGMQLALQGKIFHVRLVGIEYGWHIPYDVIAWGSSIVIAMALAAAAPATWRLIRRPTTQLLAADA